MQKKPYSHPVHKMSLEEKNEIWNIWHETGRELDDILKERGYNWESYFRSVLIADVVNNKIMTGTKPVFTKEDFYFKNLYEKKLNIFKTESFKDLLIEYEPEQKEFIFKSKV